jgi:cytochrome P450
MVQELLVFLIAGSDTSATTMTWFIYHMSKHPRVQQKLKTELMAAYDNGSSLSSDRLESLVYLDAVLKEVLRISPPFDGTFRTLTVDDHLPESGVHLYKGDQIYVSFYNLSQDPQYWSVDPGLFYPERFLEQDKFYHPFAFLPFGAGHRQCMGQELARFQLKVIITRLMQFVTFGDGGLEVNSGGYVTKFSTFPKHVGVTITFD